MLLFELAVQYSNDNLGDTHVIRQESAAVKVDVNLLLRINLLEQVILLLRVVDELLGDSCLWTFCVFPMQRVLDNERVKHGKPNVVVCFVMLRERLQHHIVVPVYKLSVDVTVYP